jgi:aryl-alcohol dehydrogenase-like predicted oxidoreductase
VGDCGVYTVRERDMEVGWDKVEFGSTGLAVSRLSVASSYGVGERDVRRAFDRGINFLFWGSRRRAGFGRAIRSIAKTHREDMVLAVQSYSRVAWMVRPSVEIAMRRAGVEQVDLLVLAWWHDAPAERILDAALELQRTGKVKHVLVSSHHRPTFQRIIEDRRFGGAMMRYSAAHPGAEHEVFPHLAARGDDGPGILAFTATRWGKLLDPKLTPPEEQTPRASDCYRFVLSNPHVHSTLIGPRNGAELDEAMTALDRGAMSEDELAWMKRVGVAVRRDAPNGSPVDHLDKWVARARGLFGSSPPQLRA